MILAAFFVFVVVVKNPIYQKQLNYLRDGSLFAWAWDDKDHCCEEMTAECVACLLGTSVEQYCSIDKHTNVTGCEKFDQEDRRGCCKENIAECLACADAVSVQKYCAEARHHTVIGCKSEHENETVQKDEQGKQHNVCCEAVTAECFSCMQGISLTEYCAKPHQSIPGCPGDGKQQQKRFNTSKSQ